MRPALSKVFLILAVCLASAAVRALTIDDFQPTALSTNTPTDFTVTISPPPSPAGGNFYSYSCTFDNLAKDIVTAQSTNGIFRSVVLRTESIYYARVTVSAGTSTTVSATFIIEAINPPPASDPDGVNMQPDFKQTINPDAGLGLNLVADKDGDVTLNVTDSTQAASASRDVATYLTDFGDSNSLIPGRSGISVRHRYHDPNVFVIRTSRHQNGSETGRTAKTLPISAREATGKNDSITEEPDLNGRTIKVRKIRGRFHLANSVPTASANARASSTPSRQDFVSVTWTIDLPAGFNPNSFNSINPTASAITLSVGNVMEAVHVDAKGRGIIDPHNFKFFRRVRIKFPRLKKGQTVTDGITRGAKVTVQMLASNLAAAGFREEGISSDVNHPPAGTTANHERKIQVATLFAGVAYYGIAHVELLVSKDDSTGVIKGRH